jgi:hypothetical protein
MTAGFVVAIAAAASAFYADRQPPVQYKVWIMDPLGCADLAVPDTTLMKICFDSSSFRGRARPLLHAALERGLDTAAVARLGLSATGTTYKRGEYTKALEDFREAIALGQFTDSIAPSPSARFFTAVAAYRAATLLAAADGCTSLREAVRYFDIALRFPFRADEPDSLRTIRELERHRTRTQDRATRACASHDTERPAGGRASTKR